mmetsp:Transcript_74813/g.242919  ORF Transcript_74813/g.242919 Transcript_74813/m.242919 type:complete len:237 (-) Transcript_74813:922-1632(-)
MPQHSSRLPHAKATKALRLGLLECLDDIDGHQKGMCQRARQCPSYSEERIGRQAEWPFAHERRHQRQLVWHTSIVHGSWCGRCGRCGCTVITLTRCFELPAYEGLPATAGLLDELRCRSIKRIRRNQACRVSPPLLVRQTPVGASSCGLERGINCLLKACKVNFAIAVCQRVLDHLLDFCIRQCTAHLAKGCPNVRTRQDAVSIGINDQEDLHKLIAVGGEGLVEEGIAQHCLWQR